MATCKDCYHHDVCKSYYHIPDEEIESGAVLLPSATNCELFEDKEKIIKTKVKLGDTVYYRQGENIKENRVTKIKTTKTPHNIITMYHLSNGRMFLSGDFGRRVFVNREQAELAGEIK